MRGMLNKNLSDMAPVEFEKLFSHVSPSHHEKNIWTAQTSKRAMAKKKFKERIRANTQRERHNMHAELRKRMRVPSRRYNRFDNVDVGARSMDDLVGEVSQGSAVPSLEANLDPRSLANFLLKKDADSGKMVLADVALSADDPRALDFSSADADDQGWKNFGQGGDNEGTNKNRYKHRGAAFIFWDRVGLHSALTQALRDLKFSHPTPVQEEVLPQVLGFDEQRKKERTNARGILEKDVIVSAETGSGKTLVFALPILQHLLLTLGVPGNSSAAAGDEAGASKKKKKSRAPIADKDDHDDGSRPSKTARLSKEGKKKLVTSKKSADDDAVPADQQSPEAAPRIMHTLIISPTRELALQIRDAFKSLMTAAPSVRLGCVVGGMAPEKQQRILNSAPHILICTPGRLWELVQKNEGCYLGHSISRRLSFLVLDEADKLLQSGRFEELKSILERIHCDVLPAGYEEVKEAEKHGGADDDTPEAEDGEELGRWDDEAQKFVPFSKEEQAEMRRKKKVESAKAGVTRSQRDQPRRITMPPPPPANHRIVMFVTSATLSLQTNYTRRDFKSHKSIIRTSNSNTMTHVLAELGMREKNAIVFNMTEKVGVVKKIHETYLRCPEKTKDLYLYYFLKTYKERTIIFVNAISMLRRLTKILEVLGVPVVGLHASMQQRQRLKFIDKFKKGDKRVLVATDIASRGLDIEGLRYVIHYQVPRSTDAYIHRCGRTARCGGTGLSLMMVGAEEHASFKKLLDSMERSVNSMETFSLDPIVVHHVRPHLQLALQIDKLQREIDKSSYNARWIKKTSDEVEIDAEDMIDETTLGENRQKAKTIKILRKQLDLMVRKDTGHYGGKGSFRSGAQAIGAHEATDRLKQRADRQVYRGAKF